MNATHTVNNLTNKELVKLAKKELKSTNPKQGQPRLIIWSNSLNKK